MVLALPTQRDCSASLTAVAMGEMIIAMDLIASCRDTRHDVRSDGSCRCGHHTPNTKIHKGS